MESLLLWVLIGSFVPAAVHPRGTVEDESRIDTSIAPAAPTLGDLPRGLRYSLTRGLISHRNLLPLAVGSTVALALLPADREISDAVVGELPELGDSGQVAGSLGAILAVTGGLLLATPFTQDHRYRSFAYSSAQGIIVTYGFVYSLKLSVDRTRPNMENDNSFPSGHSATTVALSTVAHHYYGKRIGIPLYILSALVAASRIEHGKHFPSDIVFGSTLGYIAARSAIHGSELAASPQNWSIVPTIGRSGMQLCLCGQF